MLCRLLLGSSVLCACAAQCPPCAQAPLEAQTRTPAADSAPATRSVAPTTPHGTTSDTRTNAVIAAVVVQNRQSVRACYEQERATQPELKGTLTLHFTIDPHGNVVSVERVAERSSLNLPSLTACAANALRAMTFPASSRGFESSVNYPFDFKP